MATEAQLIESDQRSRERSLDVSRSFIVQAPAGSGKTELLIQRYLKLLAVVDNPEEVLAITFTKKAAAEMQFRVLGALRMAHRGEQPLLDHQKLTFNLAAAALQRDDAIGWQLLANPRRLRIQTLDSLNALITRLRPISSPDSVSGVRVLVDAELDAAYRNSAIATLDWLGERGAMDEATREVLVHVDNNTSLYQSYLVQMLATRDQWLPFVGSGSLNNAEAAELREKFERNLEAAVTDHLQRTVKAVPEGIEAALTKLQQYAARNLQQGGSLSNPICELLELEGLPAAAWRQTARWLGLTELLLTKSGEYRRRVDRRQGFPPGDAGQKAAMHDVLEILAEQQTLAELLHGIRALPPVRYSDEQWHVLLALFRLLPLAVTELKRLFTAEGVTDHIEIALTASDAMGSAQDPGDVALLLDYQVRHVLVDEMQDTSSAQYRMLEALTGGWEEGDGRSLYCVGDPMQSIYRFRNAQVGQFLLAKRFGIGDVRLEPLLLRRNFRSGQRLVDWFNTVFPEILAPSDDPLSGAVSYSEAASVAELSGVGDCRVHPVFGSRTETEAEIGCRVIGETLAANPDEEMAVLVRGRTQLPGLLAALRRAGIAYRAIEIDRLTDLPEIIEVLALTRAAAHEADRIAWLGLLRAPWIGLDWADLHSLVREDAKSTVWELLQDPERLASLSTRGRSAVEAARGVLATLVAARPTGSLRDLVEKSWFTLGGPAILDDEEAIGHVYRYLDVLEKHERHGSLTDVAQLESMLDLERVSTAANARLQVMTMHRAKGLEFDHVLLYGLGRLPRASDRRVLSWFDFPNARGEESKVISPVGPRADLATDPVHRFIEIGEAVKDRHELARLLYVACTRARKSLHLMGHAALSADGDAFRPPPKRSLLQLLWPVLEAQYVQAFEAHVADETDASREPWIMPQLRRFASPWTVPAVVPLPGPPGTDDASREDAAVEFYWVGTEARIAGTIVHRWLFAIAEGFAEAATELPTDCRSITHRWLKEMGVGKADTEKISARVETALQQVLTDEKGRWVVHGQGHAELALTGIYNGKIESVIIDRVRVDDAGRHWIVDYKTSSHEGGDLEGFLRAEMVRHGPQLSKYKAIYEAYSGISARCALYFPLLQRFLELDE